jgi:putative ABC transport system permease protein
VFVLVTSGIVIVVVASVWVSGLVATLLYGLEPRDAVTVLGAAVMLATVAAMAAWLPARRASQIDPAVTLRYE